MLMKQLRRRLLYIAFGAAPASYLLIDLHLIQRLIASVRFEALGLSWYEMMTLAGAAIGTTALWAATVARLPLTGRWFRWSLSGAMVIGLVSMLPWALLSTYLSIADVIVGHTVEDVRTPRGTLKYMWATLLMYWLFLGPLAVAGHYLFTGMRASNKTMEPTR